MGNPDCATLEHAREQLSLSVEDLWREYFSLGGYATPLELRGFLQGALHPARREYNILIQALNEQFMVRGQNHPLAQWPRGSAD